MPGGFPGVPRDWGAPMRGFGGSGSCRMCLDCGSRCGNPPGVSQSFLSCLPSGASPAPRRDGGHPGVEDLPLPAPHYLQALGGHTRGSELSIAAMFHVSCVGNRMSIPCSSLFQPRLGYCQFSWRWRFLSPLLHVAGNP